MKRRFSFLSLILAFALATPVFGADQKPLVLSGGRIQQIPAGDTLVVPNLKDSALTPGTVPKAGAGGLLGDSIITDDGSIVGIAGTLGAEKTTNGTFDADSDWVKGANWSIAVGVATHAAGSTETLSQDAAEAAGETYKVVFTISGATAGSITVSAGGVAGTARSTNGTFNEYLTATGAGDITFTPTADFDGSIDDVSVKLVSGGSLIVDGLAVFRSPATLRGGFSISDGTPGLPSISRFLDSTDGLYFTGTAVGFSIDGVTKTICGEGCAAADTGTFSWSSTADATGSADLILLRDAANVLAQRNGASAQSYRLYTSYTDGSNYERLGINTTAGSITLVAETAGSGSDNIDLILTPAGTGSVKAPTINLSSLSASQPVVTDGSKNLVSLAYTGVTSFRKNLGLETSDSPTFNEINATNANFTGNLKPDTLAFRSGGGRMYLDAATGSIRVGLNVYSNNGQFLIMGREGAVASYTDVTFPTANKDYVSVTGIGTASAVSMLVQVRAGTGATLGVYKVIAVVNDDTVQVDRNIHASGSDIVNGTVDLHKDGIVFQPADSNGQSIRAFGGTQNKPLQLGGVVNAATGHSLTSADVLLPGALEVDGAAYFDGQVEIGVTQAAGAQAGTLANSVAAGDPAIWFKIKSGASYYAVPGWLIP